MHLFCYTCNGSSDVGSTSERLCQHCGSDFVEIQVRLTDDLMRSLHVTVAACCAAFCCIRARLRSLSLSFEFAPTPTIAGAPVADAPRGRSAAAGTPESVSALHLSAGAAA